MSAATTQLSSHFNAIGDATVVSNRCQLTVISNSLKPWVFVSVGRYGYVWRKEHELLSGKQDDDWLHIPEAGFRICAINTANELFFRN